MPVDESPEVPDLAQLSRGQPLPTRHNLWRLASALSYMQEAPHDVRPHLLLLYFGEVGSTLEPCLSYGTRYLRMWCTRVGIGDGWGHVFMHAAADGLTCAYWGRRTRSNGRSTVSSRCSQLHIAPRDYLLLRTKAESVYRKRLAEGIVRFNA